MNETNPNLKIENNEENIIYFDPQNTNINKLNTSYELKNITEESFIALYFQFNEKTPFKINVVYKNNKSEENSISKDIQNSKTIFLNSSFLLFNENETNLEGVISIDIENIDNKSLIMHFKIIEKETISLIEKDSLNFGFISSRLSYQYYYTEIFSKEEGELVLHNKWSYGKLYAKIVNKSEIIDLNNKEDYPKNDSINDNSTYLKYNPHGLYLKYSYENTSNCINGCYILITYEQEKLENENYLIGYEFTILWRTWKITDFISQIIDIPLNEYIIGSFEKGSISLHYYSISVPNDAEKLLIQIEGNYIDGFYGEGRHKIYTEKTIGNTKKLDIISNKNVLTLNKLNYEGNIISFAFRPKDTYADVLSFYYFRILYMKSDEKLYFPIDSHLGNLCLPEFNNNTNKSYCYLIYNNDYNALSRNFSISSTIQNEYFTINVTKVYHNGTPKSVIEEFIYYDNDINNSVDYFLFEFEFPKNETRDIVTSFFSNITYINPHIYSPQMFYLSKTTLYNKFNINNNYIFRFIHIYGHGGISISFLKYQKFYTSRNFKGKPIAIPIDSKTEEIEFFTSQPQYIFYFQLIYSMKNKGAEEIISGETQSQFVIGGYFPLYYYVKIKDEHYINLNVNFRINSYNESVLQNNFAINGYLLDENSINRKINGEYLQLNDPIVGFYSDIFKVGLLQVNQRLENNSNYLLLQITSNDQNYITSHLLVELLVKEYNDDIYFLPVNQYILETFEGENNTIRYENKYYLTSKLRGLDAAFLEISTAFDDINIEFDNKTDSVYDYDSYSGFKKY